MMSTFTSKLRTVGKVGTFLTMAVFILSVSMIGKLSASEPLSKQSTIIMQNETLTGRVLDSQTGEPLPGVSIFQNNSPLGQTNSSGSFSIQTTKGASIVFRYLGFDDYTYTLADFSPVTVRLSESSSQLSEVVVTALGIKRESKSLGYAVTTLSGEDLTDAVSNNWSDALKGKVAGMNLTQASSGPINSTRINLRGDRSLSGKNEAMIVIDGIPTVNGQLSSGSSQAYNVGGQDVPIDFGNGLSDLNPDDIESITVLKGAAATALYGSRAGNGALIITTKSGATKGKLGVSFSSNLSVNDVLRWPDSQYEYGQGANNRNSAGELYYSYGDSPDGSNTGSTSSAYGPKFDGQSYYQYDPSIEGQSLERLPWVPYKDNVKGFWRTGSNAMNSLAIEGAGEKYSGRFSLAHTTNEWIMPNTGFERLVASLNNKISVNDKFSINSRFSYTNKTSDNLPATGYNNQSIAYFMIFQNPNISLDAYKPMWKKGLEDIEQIHPFSSFIDNPYIIANVMTNSLKNHNIDGNVQLNYEFNPKWDLMVRSGLYFRQDRREMRRPWSSAQYVQGYYKEQDATWLEHNTDFLLNYKEQLSSRINMTAAFGGNIRKEESRNINTSATGLMLAGIYKMSNAANDAYTVPSKYLKQVNSIYALANFSFDDKIFVDITGRNDWSSTLPMHNNSYFYPSISTSYVLSDIFTLPKQISFAKLRLSYAIVGSDTDPYQLYKVYGQSPFPGSALAPSTKFNDQLMPEISNSFESGFNFSLFNNRLTADVNYYNNTTKNQVLSIPVDITTGYSSAFINAGKIRNDGIELMLSARPFVGDFRWTPTLTWAKNNNKVLELSESTDLLQQRIMTSGSATIIVEKGGTTGDIWGAGLVRNEEGQIVFDASSGQAERSAVKKIGNAYADWKAGFHNEFAYKNFKVSALLDGQYGGIIYSQTHHKMTEQGKLKHTLKGREDGFIIGDGVVKNADGSYSPNTKEVPVSSFYRDYYRRANVETNSLDASYMKLREVRIEYTFPAEIAKKVYASRLSVALYGRDLLLVSKFPIFDPETASLNGASIMPGVEMGQLPTPRTFGFNLNFTL